MWSVFIQIVSEFWIILEESAVYMLFGFAMAGLLKAFLPDDFISRHLGRGNVKSVVKAALLGLPLPLCSCGVVPGAAGLRQQKASRGATASFLISTPETGIDSVAITYGLLDPLMTLLRPLSAGITAVTAGLLVNLTDKTTSPNENFATDCDAVGCRCSSQPVHLSTGKKIRSGLQYAFGDLLADIGTWFLVGILVAGLISTFVTPAFVAGTMGTGIQQMVMMLCLAVPFYVCATASTPIAASLAMKGVSPGSALVFLLAGPATNAASMAVVVKILGKKGAVVYLASIVCCSLGLGILTDWLYVRLGYDIAGWIAGRPEHHPGMWETVAAVILLLLIARTFIPVGMRSRAGNEEQPCCR